MAWFSGKVSLGNFPDFAGAVNKLSESVKNIEKNFDSALGLEEKSDDPASTNEGAALWPLATDRKTLFEPIMGFMGQKASEDAAGSLEKPTSPVKEKTVVSDDDSSVNHAYEQTSVEEANEEMRKVGGDAASDEKIMSGSGEKKDNAAAGKNEAEVFSDNAAAGKNEAEVFSTTILAEASEENVGDIELAEDANNLHEEAKLEEISSPSSDNDKSTPSNLGQVEVSTYAPIIDDNGLPDRTNELKGHAEVVEISPTLAADVLLAGLVDENIIMHDSDLTEKNKDTEADSGDSLAVLQHSDMEAPKVIVNFDKPQNDDIVETAELIQYSNDETNNKEHLNTKSNLDVADSVAELEKVKKEMKMMEIALQGAARQAQAKADEIANFMNENEQLKALIDDLRRKSNEAEIESLHEEYHQRIASIERKVYALTKERDTLRREQNKKSDATALLKEKDEIISQVMAEGEELSKKQAAQESQIRKLRAQIRELEEEKKSLLTKLQAEENKVESIKRDKLETENVLQDTVEKHQAELASQKEYYTNALNAAKEAEALAEARADSEARTELEKRLREAEDRESMLVRTLEELRQTLSRKEQQAVFREDMIRREIEDLQKRYQASERRCEELITQVPESTRPLLRQIEAMQETASGRAESWAAVERSLNSRLQESEATAAAAEEKERSINERLTQTMSRINVLEAQLSCLRTEQTQLTRSLEKERQKAAESRQEYLTLKEESDTLEGRVNQLEQEIRELRRKHKDELHEALTHQEFLQQELEREKAARLDQERAVRLQSSPLTDKSSITRQKSDAFENGILSRKISSTSSLNSMEESYFLQSTLDSSENLSERRNVVEGPMNPYYMKSVTSSTFEAALRQKEGELASYMSRLASMESIRDSLAEELVKLTAQCEKFQTDVAILPGIRAELEALRRRHSAALELMGERDEELEELRADITDVKEMYREQVNLLVNKIHTLGSSVGAA